MAAAGRTPVSNGIYILYTDETVSPYNTLTPGKTPVGVLLKNDLVSIVIHPSEGSSKTWSSNTKTTIPGVTTTTRDYLARADYAGESNTNAVYASGLQGTAFTFAREASYADGRQGYLPAAGEMEQMRLNATNINTALRLINGNTLQFDKNSYWSSTQYSDRRAWYWFYNDYSAWYYGAKSDLHLCRSVAAYE